jgi:hypothetical protein
MTDAFSGRTGIKEGCLLPLLLLKNKQEVLIIVTMHVKETKSVQIGHK